ncbi:hypothetical protein GGX14DRAFT_647065 [Mycena pura]|uniref:Uncharacterized protein n=1 Tax=Mycena pura TaxID=153505 RepID=A0AAD6V6T6_9AGAR|nr:hypothetical protein GGX14DRAFT_647065 [Mycena pura]
MPIPFGYRTENALTIAQLNQDHKPFRTLFCIPLNEDYKRNHSVPKSHRLPPFAASSLQILDVLRLASLFLGVLSFPDEFPTTNLGAYSNMTWVTAHQDTEGVVEEEDITKNLGGVSVRDWSGRILWVRINGKQPGMLLFLSDVDETLRRILSYSLPAINPISILQLRRKISRDFEKELDKCEFTGDRLGCEYMHVIPFELGSSVIYILLKAVESSANAIWGTFEESLRKLYDTSSPTIGNVVLLNQEKWDTIQDPQGKINITQNFLIASSTIHYVGDKRSGLLLSTQPRLWLLEEAITQTYTAFTREVVDPCLPSAPTPRIETDAEVTAFLLWSLSDAVTLYRRFATKALTAEADKLVREFRTKLKEQKKILKNGKRKADAGDEGQRKKQKKDDHGGGDGGENDGAGPSGHGNSSNNGGDSNQPDSGDGENDGAGDSNQNDKGNNDGAGPSGSNDAGHTSSQPDDGGCDIGDTSKQGNTPDMTTSGTGGQHSDSSFGTDLMDLSLVSSVADSSNTEVDDVLIKKVGTSVYPSLEKWCSLLTPPDELQYIEGDEEDEPELTPHSKLILENLRLPPESRGIERLGVMHEKATAFLLMLANWSAYA